jgi:phospholipid/cholesterol/gamma-HCH transport system permease protein
MKKKISQFFSENFSDTSVSNFFSSVTKITFFSFRFLKQVFFPPYEFYETIRQSYHIGCKTFPLVAITAGIMGLVLTLQSRPVMVEFGAESWIPAMVGISIVREISPVITALICAGKIGSGIGAELASMRITEQIDAMEVSGINAFKYLVVTRVLGTIITIPILVIFADAIALLGSFIGVNIKGDVSLQLFFSHVFHKLEFLDIIPATIKTFFFGGAIGIVSCYNGYFSDEGTEGVGRSANSSVVISSLLIFIIDMVAVQLTNIFYP